MTPRTTLAASVLVFLLAGPLCVSACASAYVSSGALDGSAGEAGLSTAAPSSDATPVLDAATRVDGGTASPCSDGTVQSTRVLCADFDTKKLEDFTDSLVESGGTLDVSIDRALSAPRSLLATLPRRQAGPASYAHTDKLIDGWRRVRLGFDVYVEAPDRKAGDMPVALAGILLASSSQASGSLLFVSEGGTGLSVESAPAASRYFDAPAVLGVGQWTHIELDFDPTTGRYLHSVGGKDGVRNFAIPSKGASPKTIVSVGISSFDAPAPNLRAYYDNVVIDTP